MSLGFQGPIEYAKECNGCEPISRPVAPTRKHCALAVEFIAAHLDGFERVKTSKREHHMTSQRTNRQNLALCTNLGHATEASRCKQPCVDQGGEAQGSSPQDAWGAPRVRSVTIQYCIDYDSYKTAGKILKDLALVQGNPGCHVGRWAGGDKKIRLCKGLEMRPSQLVP
jgi:hypothetical protein